jgi:integration host factor subunit alpha
MDVFLDSAELGLDARAERRRTSTRADLLERALQNCPGMSRNQARDILELALAEVMETLVQGEPVRLRSFGLFTVREKRARVGRNPRTGVEVPITPRRVLTFKPSPVLLERVREADVASDDGVGEHGAE